VRLRHPATIPSIKSNSSSKGSSKPKRDLCEANDLIKRAYWALAINALEPVNSSECYDQEDIEDLTDDLREFLNG